MNTANYMYYVLVYAYISGGQSTVHINLIWILIYYLNFDLNLN